MPEKGAQGKDKTMGSSPLSQLRDCHSQTKGALVCPALEQGGLRLQLRSYE